MNNTEIKYIIDTTVKFFTDITNKPAICGIPTIKNSVRFVMEYTGIIGISGRRKGSIYFTATEEMLISFAKIMLQSDNPTREDIMDLVGEIANTISGNLRASFGDEFMVSVPVTVEGQVKDIRILHSTESYMIPIKWEGFKSYLVVSLE